MTGWIAVQREVDINYDLENSPLQIRTDSVVGSNEQVIVYFYTAQRDWTGGVQINFSSSPQYYLRFCTSLWTILPTSLPTQTDMIWTITLIKTPVTRLNINCNNREVLNVVMSACSDSKWSEKWSKDVGKIRFTSTDKASGYYRPGK